MNVYEPLPPGFNPLARITPALTLRKEKVASITAMIFFHIILHPAVLIYVIYGGYLLTNLGPRSIQVLGPKIRWFPSAPSLNSPLYKETTRKLRSRY